jgi:FtsZ-binding cell division protein ZapB
MMTKLEKLEADMKEIKHSLEFAHAEIADLKKKAIPAKQTKQKQREKIEKLDCKTTPHCATK